MGNGCMSINKTEKVHILENDIEENKRENRNIEYTKNIKITMKDIGLNFVEMEVIYQYAQKN